VASISEMSEDANHRQSMTPSAPRPELRASALLRRLGSGDLRSVGAADEVAREAIADETLVALLMSGMAGDEPVVRMRCADALEKATRVRPDYLRKHVGELRSLLVPAQAKEVLWHVLQMTPRVRWPQPEVAALVAAVEECLDNPSSIVRSCAMQALAELAVQRPEHRARTTRLLRELSASGTPAMQARGRGLLRALTRPG
jgi:hypothetical protein